MNFNPESQTLSPKPYTLTFFYNSTLERSSTPQTVPCAPVRKSMCLRAILSCYIWPLSKCDKRHRKTQFRQCGSAFGLVGRATCSEDPSFLPFVRRTNTGTLLDRLGLPGASICTKNQPRRQTQRPNGHARLPSSTSSWQNCAEKASTLRTIEHPKPKDRLGDC